MNIKQVDINNVKVGKRFRKDMGDMKALSADIKDQGLLVPLGVDRKNNLVMGERRLRACKALGMKTVPVVVLDTIKDELDLRKAEEAENNLHKPMTYTERVAQREAIYKLRSSPSIRKNHPDGNKNGRGGSMAIEEEAAKKAGFSSRREYQRVKKVAESGDGDLIELMNRSSQPGYEPEEALTPSAAVSVLDALGPVDRRKVYESAKPREELKNIRNRKRHDDAACSDMTQKVWRAMAPINWVTDNYAPEEGYMDGAFKVFATKPPMNKKANQAGLPGLLEAVKEVQAAYAMFAKELKEVING